MDAGDATETWGGGLAAAWRTARPLIAAGLGAHAVIVGLTEFVSPVPLLAALVATLVFAAVSVAWRSHPPKFLSRDLLELGIAWKLQGRAFGGLGGVTKRRLAELALAIILI